MQQHFRILTLLTFCQGLLSATVVTNLNSDGPGSLREAITNGNSSEINFAPELAGGTIPMDGEKLELTRPVRIIGPEGSFITLDGQGNSGILEAFNVRSEVSFQDLPTFEFDPSSQDGTLDIEELIFDEDPETAFVSEKEDQPFLDLVFEEPIVLSSILLEESVTGDFPPLSDFTVSFLTKEGTIVWESQTYNVANEEPTFARPLPVALPHIPFDRLRITQSKTEKSHLVIASLKFYQEALVFENLALRNASDVQGAADFFGSDVTFRNCLIADNTNGSNNLIPSANGQGGAGLSLSNCIIHLERTAIVRNRASDGSDGLDEDLATETAATRGGRGGSGGGIVMSRTQGFITNCVIAENRSGNGGDGGDALSNDAAGLGGNSGNGAGLSVNSSKIEFRHCTIVDNQGGEPGQNGATASGAELTPPSGALGAGIFGFNVAGRGSGLIESCVIARNLSPREPDVSNSGFGDENNAFVYRGQNILSDNTGAEIQHSPSSATTITLVPTSSLLPLADDGSGLPFLYPTPSSPLVDTAVSPSWVTTDQRGLPRAESLLRDIGAVELQESEASEQFFFGLDTDGDGSANGLEEIIGTNPFLADAAADENLRIQSLDANTVTLTFGFAPDPLPNTRLRLLTGNTLTGFPAILADSDDPAFPLSSATNRVTVEVPLPGNPARFFRLEAELLEASE